MPTALNVHRVGKSFGDHEILNDFSLSLRTGEFVSIVGRSGVGKTTLLRMIAGLDVPDSGEIRHAGGDQPRLGQVGYMPQRDSLMPWRRVLDNIAIAGELKRESKQSARMHAYDQLQQFGLETFARHRPSELSAGMRQRVSLLRTFYPENNLVLLDEPFASLDAITRTESQNWLAENFVGQGRSLLLVTHDIDEALRLSNRVLVLGGSPATIIDEVVVGSDPAGLEERLLSSLLPKAIR